MTDREKLTKLLDEIHAVAFVEEKVTNGFTLTKVFGECLAALILSHGVTVREMQKPIEYANLKDFIGEIIWKENDSGELLPIRIFLANRYNVAYVEFERAEDCESEEHEYNITWRCWAEKPTEEERKAAEPPKEEEK